MRITVCELRNDPEQLIQDWHRLIRHVNAHGSELVVLPEMPFYPWIARVLPFTQSLWIASVRAHDDWLKRLDELTPATVIGTRPVTQYGRRFNEGFVWSTENGYQAVHTKCYLPDEAGFWEASWYERGKMEFAAIEVNGCKIGFLICTELWFNHHARGYAKEGVHLVVCPRATPGASADKWIAGGRTAAVVSGAFCVSSNRGGTDRHGMLWGGRGWIIEPEEGDVLAVTSPSQPIITLDLDLEVAARAKQTYPRYVQD
jgi:N-carbamoylputrescine amidase